MRLGAGSFAASAMVLGGTLAASGAATLGSGCAPRTEAIDAARAGPGAIAFGVSRHHDKVTGEETGVGVAALSGRGRADADRVWRVAHGGRELWYCGPAGAEPRCARARFEEAGPAVDESLELVVAIPEAGSADTARGEPAPDDAAVWVLGGSAVRYLQRCDVVDGQPRCRLARRDGEPVRPSAMLGAFVLLDEGRSRDVVWVVERERDVLRCTSPAPGPAECARARLE
jgi:hypothetical protein